MSWRSVFGLAVLGLSCIVALLVFSSGHISGDDLETPPPQDLTATHEFSAVVKLMDASLSRHEEALRALVVRLNDVQRRRSSNEPQTVHPAIPAKSLDELTSAMRELALALASHKTMADRSATTGENLADAIRNRASGPSVDLQQMFKTAGDAKRHMLMMRRLNVLEYMGAPEKIFSPLDGQVNWVYPTSVVIFTDGRATNVVFRNIQ